MEKEKTPQELIIEADPVEMLVSAGAGCGKSTTMKNKVQFRIEKCGFSLKDIIILTFTNASRDDIQKKIREAMLDKYQKTGEESWLKEYEYVDQADICTFDAYSQSLFKKYAYKLGLQSEVNIIDEGVATYIKQDLLEKILNELENDFDVENLETYFTIRHSSELVEPILGFYNRICENQVDTKLFLDNLVDMYLENRDTIVKKFTDSKLSLVPELLKAYNDLTYDAREIIYEYLSQFEDISSYDDLYCIDYSFITDLPSGKNKEFSKKNNIDNYNALQKIKDILKEFALLNPIEELNWLYECSYPNVCALAKICKRLEEEYLQYEMRYSAYTYNDIAKLVIRILKENQDVLDEIKYSKKEIYVDEYQDTSDIQEEMVSMIGNNNIFRVGDIKQSIYRFRNANPDIFQKKYDDFLQNKGGVLKTLDTNYRSRDQVLKAINEMFDPLMTLDFDGINYKEEHHLKTGHEKFTSTEPGIEFHLVIDKNEDDKALKVDDVRINTFEEVLDDIEYKIKYGKKMNIKGETSNLDYGDFCILTRNKTRYSKYSEIARGRDIPLECEITNPFMPNPDIVALSSVIALIDDIENRGALFSLLKSFIFECGETYIFDLSQKLKKYRRDYKNDYNTYRSLRNEACPVFEMIENIRDLKNNSSLYDLLNHIYKEFNFFEKISVLPDPLGAEGRLIYMLKVAESFMVLEKDLNEFSNYLKKLNTPSLTQTLDISYNEIRPKNDNSIQLMTIHKSKGLEYPFVYIIETDSKIGKIDKNSLVSYSKDCGIAFNEFNSETYLWNMVKEDNKLKQKQEDFRMLYVAATRAKQGLVIYCAGLENGVKEVASKITPYQKQEFKTYADIIRATYLSVPITSTPEFKKVSKQAITYNTKPLEFKEIKSIEGVLEKGKVSHGINNLITKEKAELLKRGTALHEVMEYLDFNNPDFANLTEKEKEDAKAFIDLVINNKEICDTKIIRTYREYELAHGATSCSIDLLIETETKFIVVDYKMANINNSAYLKQVGAYMELVKQKSGGIKDIEGYLYSLEKHELKKVEMVSDYYFIEQTSIQS